MQQPSRVPVRDTFSCSPMVNSHLAKGFEAINGNKLIATPQEINGGEKRGEDQDPPPRRRSARIGERKQGKDANPVKQPRSSRKIIGEQSQAENKKEGQSTQQTTRKRKRGGGDSFANPTKTRQLQRDHIDSGDASEPPAKRQQVAESPDKSDEDETQLAHPFMSNSRYYTSPCQGNEIRAAAEGMQLLNTPHMQPTVVTGHFAVQVEFSETAGHPHDSDNTPVKGMAVQIDLSTYKGLILFLRDSSTRRERRPNKRNGVGDRGDV
jgi:hypothetical protein